MDFLLLVSQGAAVYFSSVVAGGASGLCINGRLAVGSQGRRRPGMQITSCSNALSIPYVSGVVDET